MGRRQKHDPFYGQFRVPNRRRVDCTNSLATVFADSPGLYHLAGGERMSRWQIGELLAARIELNPQLVPGSAADHRRHGHAHARGVPGKGDPRGHGKDRFGRVRRGRIGRRKEWRLRRLVSGEGFEGRRGKELVPARYNTATTFGLEVSPDSPDIRTTWLLDLKSSK